jgi:putative membrane protein
VDIGAVRPSPDRWSGAMIRILISAVVHLAANAVGLLVAASILDDMSVSADAFVIAVLIFSVVEMVVGPMIRQAAMRNANALLGATSLVVTFVGLLVTSLVSDGLVIEGFDTWALATVIVWLAALLATMLLPLLFVKKKVAERQA